VDVRAASHVRAGRRLEELRELRNDIGGGLRQCCGGVAGADGVGEGGRGWDRCGRGARTEADGGGRDRGDRTGRGEGELGCRSIDGGK